MRNVTNLEKKRTGAYSHTKFHKGIVSFEIFFIRFIQIYNDKLISI